MNIIPWMFPSMSFDAFSPIHKMPKPRVTSDIQCLSATFALRHAQSNRERDWVWSGSEVRVLCTFLDLVILVVRATCLSFCGINSTASKGPSQSTLLRSVTKVKSHFGISQLSPRNLNLLIALRHQ